MDELISRQDAIEARRYTFGNDEFNLEAAYHDCKLVFDGITDDDSFQEADTGLILYYANEIIYALQKVLEGDGAKVSYKQLTAPKEFVLLTTENGDEQFFNVDLIVRIQPYYVGGKEKAVLVCSNDDGFVVEESVNEVLFLINNARRQS